MDLLSLGHGNLAWACEHVREDIRLVNTCERIFGL